MSDDSSGVFLFCHRSCIKHVTRLVRWRSRKTHEQYWRSDDRQNISCHSFRYVGPRDCHGLRRRTQKVKENIWLQQNWLSYWSNENKLYSCHHHGNAKVTSRWATRSSMIKQFLYRLRGCTAICSRAVSKRPTAFPVMTWSKKTWGYQSHQLSNTNKNSREMSL